MIIKTTPLAIFLLIIFISTTSSLPTEDLVCGNRYSLRPDPEDCSNYYVCIGRREPLEKICPFSTLFHPTILLCLPTVFFSQAQLKSCEDRKNNAPDDSDFPGMPHQTVEVKWTTEESDGGASDGKNNSLPMEIMMKLPTKHHVANLRLRKQPQVTENLKVVVKERGKQEKWNSPVDEEWDIYSDVAKKASMSVATRKNAGASKIVYDGTFEVNNTLYRLRPLTKKLMYPVNTNTSIRLLINGTSYLLSEEKASTTQYDAPMKDMEERATQDDSTLSVMSTLEKLINNDVSTQAATGQISYGLELFIVLDYSIFYKWYIHSSETNEQAKKLDAITNIRYFYTHIVNGINDRYSSINEPDMKFYVRLVGYFIAQTPGDAPFIEQNGIKLSSSSADPYKTLDAFEKWVVEESRSPVNPLPKFDSAALFTSYKLVVSWNNNVITGLANIGATCTLRGVSINKDQLEYATIQTATHEIGHNLGAQHDNPQINSCQGGDQNIMASAPGGLTDATFYNPYEFSPCSINYFRQYINQLNRDNNNCLKNAAYDADPSSTAYFLQQNPGQKYSADKQCKLLYGLSSFYCAGGGERDFKICREMLCWDQELQQCVGKVEIRAVDGTSCGNRMWCSRSTCEANSNAPATADDKCIYGDFKDYFEVSNQRNTCENHIRNSPELCYQQHYREMCCASCKKIKKSSAVGCEYGNQRKTCESISDSDCYDSYTLTSCCATCAQRQTRHNVANCRFGDKVAWCSKFSSQNAYQCYQTNEWCCETCSRLQTGIQGCMYGDMVEGCTNAHCSSSSHRQDCCYTCRNYINVPTTTTPPPSYPAECPVGNTVNWCGTLFKGDCYTNKQHCCQTCLGYFDASSPGCEYGDQASWCSSYVRSSEECRIDNVARQCCKTCKPHLTPNSNPPTCPNGDEGQFCATIAPFECYNYKKTCCATCQKYFEPERKNCEYGDKVTWCQSYVTSSTLCARAEVAENCCKTCSNIKTTNVTENTGLVDMAEWCPTMFAGFCYDSNTEATCAATCKRLRDGRTGECRYGNFYDWCSPQFCSINKVECCESCP